jgi:hypothetical protein
MPQPKSTTTSARHPQYGTQRHKNPLRRCVREQQVALNVFRPVKQIIVTVSNGSTDSLNYLYHYQRAGTPKTTAYKSVQMLKLAEKFGWRYLSYDEVLVDIYGTTLFSDGGFLNRGRPSNEFFALAYDSWKKGDFVFCDMCGKRGPSHQVCESCGQVQCANKCPQCREHACACNCQKCVTCNKLIGYEVSKCYCSAGRRTSLNVGSCPNCTNCCPIRCQACGYANEERLKALRPITELDTLCVCFTCEVCKNPRASSHVCGCGCAYMNDHKNICYTCCTHFLCAQCRRCRQSDACKCVSGSTNPPRVYDLEGENAVTPMGVYEIPRTFWKKRNEPLVFWESARNEFTINPSKRFASAEIETERMWDLSAVTAACEKWKTTIVSDGSVSGYEINTAPANGDKLVRLITDITTALKEDQVSIASNCGLHVHLDARTFGYMDIRRLVATYAAVEKALFLMVEPSRYNGHYSTVCGEIYANRFLKGTKLEKPVRGQSNPAKLAVIDSVYNIDSQGNRPILQGNKKIVNTKISRYKKSTTIHRAGNRLYALNLHSWFHRGTVEFRMHHATTNGEKILMWMRVLAEIVDFAEKSGESALLNTVRYRAYDGRTGIELLGSDPRDYVSVDVYGYVGLCNDLTCTDCQQFRGIRRRTSPGIHPTFRKGFTSAVPYATALKGITVLKRILSDTAFQYYIKRVRALLFKAPALSDTTNTETV